MYYNNFVVYFVHIRPTVLKQSAINMQKFEQDFALGQ